MAESEARRGQGMLERCGVGDYEEPPSRVNTFPRSAIDMAGQASELDGLEVHRA